MRLLRRYVFFKRPKHRSLYMIFTSARYASLPTIASVLDIMRLINNLMIIKHNSDDTELYRILVRMTYAPHVCHILGKAAHNQRLRVACKYKLELYLVTAQRAGIEPTITVLETVVLPLHYQCVLN